jgi:AcrR family transcriptional regulator
MACPAAAVAAVDTTGRRASSPYRNRGAAMTAARPPAASSLGARKLPTKAISGDLTTRERYRPEHHQWLQAGYAILAERGPKALTIPALCRRMGVKSHSFVRDFGTLKAYRNSLARSWASLSNAERARFIRIRESPPRQRLSLITATLTSQRHWLLERAMREWARADAEISASVRAADQRVVDVMAAAFLDAGFDRTGANLRANAAFAAGVGFLHLSGSTPSTRAIALCEPFLDLLFQQAGPPAAPRLEKA